MTDPIEAIVRDGLNRKGFAFTEDGKPGSEQNKALDFYLTDYGIAIKVKQFHSDRIAGQMARHPNVIAVQGRQAAEFFAALLVDYKAADAIEALTAERDAAIARAERAEAALREARTGERVQHIKRGSTYRVIGRGKVQTDVPLTDYTEVVVYQSETDAGIWVRPISEFDDGRFARLPLPEIGGE